MSLETTSAPEQPAQVAQTSSEKKTGASNVSGSDFARKLAAAQIAPPAFTPKTETVQAAPVTEAPKAPNAEVKETETKTEGGEPPAETAEETETETEEVLSPETHALDPKLQAKIDRRIGKEVGKTKKAIERAAAAEARAADLESRLSAQPQEVEKEVHVPVPADVPLAHITSIDQLHTYKESLENDIVEAEMLLYSEFPPEGLDTKWGKITKPALIKALTQAKKDARNAVPARERFLLARGQATQTAQEKFPFLKDPMHPGYQMAKQALRDNPVLRTYPNTDYLVGMLVKGQLAMQAEEKGNAEVKTPAKPKPKPTNGQSEIASDASITRAPTGLMNQQALQSERSKVLGTKKSLGHKDFAELLKANQRYRNSQ